MKEIQTDVVIVGGGIAGLWAFNLLNNAGIHTALVEINALGAGQTICSQGIIHGGLKYALHGALSRDAQEMSNVPAIWTKCLQGDGQIDLRKTKILSQGQYLFSTGDLATKVSSFFASKALKSGTKSVLKNDYPSVFLTEKFKGSLYQLQEDVLDVPSLLGCLADKHRGNLLKADNCKVQFISKNQVDFLEVEFSKQKYSLKAKNYVFLAGEGNGKLLEKNDYIDIPMQTRALHMSFVKAKELPVLYAHCIGIGMMPRITITTHQDRNGINTWYVGGEVAEHGVGLNKLDQLQHTKQELEKIFPWLDFSSAEIGSFMINRAERWQRGGKKPATYELFSANNIQVGWPTKLALSPFLAAEILKNVSQIKNEASDDLSVYPKPEIAKVPWF